MSAPINKWMACFCKEVSDRAAFLNKTQNTEYTIIDSEYLRPGTKHRQGLKSFGSYGRVLRDFETDNEEDSVNKKLSTRRQCVR